MEQWRGVLSDKSTTDSTRIIKFNILKIHEEISDAKCVLRKKNICLNDINGKAEYSKVNHTDNIKLPQEVP